jgi:hypothetical protein
LNPELAQWQDLAFHDGKFHNSIVALVVEAVWPGTAAVATPHEKSFRSGTVHDVLGGHPNPLLSQKDRDRITEAAKPILAGARP